MPRVAAENGDATEVMIKQPGENVALQVQRNDEGGTPLMPGEDDNTSKDTVPVPCEILETPAERRARRISHLVAYITTFNMAIGFSIVLTGVWPYLQQLSPGVSKQALGWVISSNPLGQMVASPLLGLWGNKAGSNRGAFLLTMVLFAIGNGLYAILNVFGSSAMGVMIFSRFLVGVSSANIAIIRSYIAASTKLKERTLAVALTSASQGLGFIFGPAIQTALAVAFSQDEHNSSINVTTSTAEADVEDEGLGVEWNMYTATGWIGVVLGMINFVLFMPCIFKEHSIAVKEAELQMQQNKCDTLKLPKPDYIALINVLSSFFIFLMIYVLLETLLVPMCIDLYAWTDKMAVTVVGIGLSFAGGMAIVAFLMAGFLSKRFDERKVLIVGGIIPMTLSMIIHFPMGSTYPKIRNCTASLPPVTTLAPKIASIPVNLTDQNMTQPPITLNGTDSPLPTLSTVQDDIDREDMITTSYIDLLTDTDGEEKITTPYVDVLTDMNETLTMVLKRRRRHAVRDDTCDDVGCPPEQEWCFYTPIIEQSQLIVANVIALVGYPMAFTLCSSIFSKLLGPKPQGLWMGILTSTGSLSRVTGPIIVTYMYTDLGPRWTFGILFFILLGTLITNLVFYKRMVPMQVT